MEGEIALLKFEYEEERTQNLELKKERRDLLKYIAKIERSNKILSKDLDLWKLKSNAHKSDLTVCRKLLSCTAEVGKPCPRLTTIYEQDKPLDWSGEAYSLP